MKLGLISWPSVASQPGSPGGTTTVGKLGHPASALVLNVTVRKNTELNDLQFLLSVFLLWLKNRSHLTNFLFNSGRHYSYDGDINPTPIGSPIGVPIENCHSGLTATLADITIYRSNV